MQEAKGQTFATNSGSKLRWSVAASVRAGEAARAPKLEGRFPCPTKVGDGPVTSRRAQAREFKVSRKPPGCTGKEEIASFPWNGCGSRGLRPPKDALPGDPGLSARQAAAPQRNYHCTGQVCARLRLVGNFLVRDPASPGGRAGERAAEHGEHRSAPPAEEAGLKGFGH